MTPTDQPTSAHAEEFRDINLALLLLCQRVAQDDLGEAEIRFGVSREEAQLIRDLPLLKLQALASSSMMLFAPRSLLSDLLPGRAEGEHAVAGAVLRSIAGDRK